MKIFRRVLVLLLVILVLIQFFRPAKNLSHQPQPAAIAAHFVVPANVNTILKKACNDCHSNNTTYPWYNNIQPVAWWLGNHVKDGKRGLNFDELATYRLRKQYKRMEDVEEMVENGSMPLNSYTWVHKDAKLNTAEKEALISWSKAVRDSLMARYPADSLIKKT